MIERELTARLFAAKRKRMGLALAVITRRVCDMLDRDISIELVRALHRPELIPQKPDGPVVLALARLYNLTAKELERTGIKKLQERYELLVHASRWSLVFPGDGVAAA